jgi:hypothetical protein
MTTIRTGKTPEGKSLDGKFMPFDGTAVLSDAEIEGLYKYIQSQPAAQVHK